MKKTILLILILSPIVISSQNNVKIGFRGELSYINFIIDNKHSSNITIPFIQNFYFPLGLKLNAKSSFEVRPGIILANDYYEGFELGIFFSYLIHQTNFYVVSGINFHFNKDTDGNEGFYGNTIALFDMEVGYSLSKKTSIIFSIQYPQKYDYGFYGNAELERNIVHNVKNIIKLGMRFWMN